ncbi:MAG: ABC transporter ATP-binding protein [Actinomycetota bacterium]
MTAMMGGASAPPSPGYEATGGAIIRWALKRQWRWIALGATTGMIWMAGFAAAPVLVGYAIDDAIDGRSGARMAMWAVAFLGVVTASAIAGAVRHRCAITLWATIGLLAEGHLTRRVLDRRGGIDRPPAELVSLGVGDANKIGRIGDLTNRGGGAVVMLVVVAVWLLATSVSLGLLVLIAVPMSAAAILPFLSRYDERSTVERRELASASAAAADGIQGLRTAHGLGGGRQIRSWFRERSGLMHRSALSLVRIEATLFATVGAIPLLTLVPVLWYGGVQVLDGTISPGTFVTVVGLAQFLAMPLQTLGEAAGVVTAGRASARRIEQIVTTSASIDAEAATSTGSASDSTLRGDRSNAFALRLEAVTVGELGPVDLQVARDATVGVAADHQAIAALAGILARHRPSGGGTIRVGAERLDEIPLDDVHHRLVVIDSERPWLLSASLLDNLRLARSSATRADAEAALRNAACDEILARSDALDRLIGERGLQLSGGQRQRIATAQALLAPAQIVALIEPTSALDAATESLYVERFMASARPTTLLLTTSPRLLSACDEVAFIHNGVVARTASHHELLETEPAYGRLVLGVE